MGFRYKCIKTVNLAEIGDTYHFVPQVDGRTLLVERCVCYSNKGFICKQNGEIVLHKTDYYECQFKHGSATFEAEVEDTEIHVLCEGNILLEG